MLNIIKYYKFWFAVSLVLFIAGIVSLSVFGLERGIEFKGGTLTQIRFDEQKPGLTEIQTVVRDAGVASAQIQPAGENSAIIRTEPLEKEQHDKMILSLTQKFGRVTEEQFTSIGPLIGRELRSQAFVQLSLVTLGIILYIAYAFRKVTRPV